MKFLVLFTALNLITMSNPGQPSIHSLSFNAIDGSARKLSEFKGKKVLIVNTASECGYTPQYENLQQLHEAKKDELVIIGFPCNQFGKQEPGSNAEIAGFCKKNYGVSFLMAEKIEVKGPGVHPVYKWLSNKEENGKDDYEVRWNFHKFLLNEDGELMQAFPSSVDPMDEKILGLI